MGAVISMGFSPDGRTLVVGYSMSIVRLWDVRDEREIGAVHVPGTTRYGARVMVAVSPGGQTFITSGRDVRIWRLSTRAQLGKPFGRGGGPVAVSPDGRTIATGGTDGKVRLWDTRSRIQIGAPLDLRHGDYRFAVAVESVLFSPDGQTIAASGAERGATVWNLRTRRRVATPFTDAITGSVLAFSPDGRFLAGGDASTGLSFWDTTTGKTRKGPRDDSARVVAFSPDSHTLAVAGLGGEVRLWDARRERVVGRLLLTHSRPFNTVSFSPDGHTVVAGTDTGEVWLWDTTEEQPLGVQLRLTNADTAAAYCNGPATPCGADAISSLFFSPDGSTVSAVNDWPTVSTWNVASQQQIGQTKIIATDPDGNSGALATLSADGLVEAQTTSPWLGGTTTIGWQRPGSTWTNAAGVPVEDDINSLALTSDGGILAAGGYGLWVWDTSKNQQMAAAWGDPSKRLSHIESLAFVPHQQTLATGSSDGSVSFWDPSAHTQLGKPLTASRFGAITSIAYSPDGTIFATASSDWTIRLWDSTTHSELGPPLRDSGPVNAVAFSPVGQNLVSASLADVRLWDVQTQSGKSLDAI
jgi:WD40 repeat protein